MPLTIAVGTLAELAMPDFCPRCFWLKLKCKKLPFQMPMPGIFNSIDRYVKGLVHRHFDASTALPPWYPDIGPVVGRQEPPSWRVYAFTESKSGVTLRGEADDIFELEGSRYHIVDYKTAKFTGAQDALFPRYEFQLNAYAYIGERTFFKPVSALSLIYLEPVTDIDSNPGLLRRSRENLHLGFIPRLLSVGIKPDSFVEVILQRARDIESLGTPPRGTLGCTDCESLAHLVDLASSTS